MGMEPSTYSMTIQVSSSSPYIAMTTGLSFPGQAARKKLDQEPDLVLTSM